MIDFAQYSGLWCIEPSRFSTILGSVQSLNLTSHLAAVGSRDIAAAKSERRGSIALVDIGGVLTKRGSSMSDAGSMIQLQRVIRSAASNPEVGSILLRVDSPGGTVSGTADLAEAVRQAATAKPVIAYVEDLAASAAYWVASQATVIYANNATALIGSIGTYYAILDLSKAFSKEGVETVVIRSAPLKGAGVPGDEITPEQRAVWQETVDETQKQFDLAVTRGRRLTAAQLKAVSTGRVWTAAQAVRLGLVDDIRDFAGALTQAATLGRIEPVPVLAAAEPAFYSRRLSPQDRRRVGLS